MVGNRKTKNRVFVTEGVVKSTRGKPLKARHVLNNVKTAVLQIGIDPSTVWAHLMRKSFKKVLRRAGLEDDVSEALMGHTLPNSKGSYFDSADMEQARDEYKSAESYFSRVDHKKVEQLEEEIPKRDMEIQTLKGEVESLRGMLSVLIGLQTKKVDLEDVRKLAEGNKAFVELAKKHGLTTVVDGKK